MRGNIIHHKAPHRTLVEPDYRDHPVTPEMIAKEFSYDINITLYPDYKSIA